MFFQTKNLRNDLQFKTMLFADGLGDLKLFRGSIAKGSGSQGYFYVGTKTSLEDFWVEKGKFNLI